MSTLSLRINGQIKTFEHIDPDMPLLWLLRDELQLVGTKYGCGIAQCGACTVHLNGQAIRSCSVTVASAAGKNITTIEGLGTENQLHPLQQAWIDLDVAQCGYCQAGQLMSAVALLEDNPRPSDAEIDSAMSGNLCRCGTYKRIKAAIHSAANTLALAQEVKL